MKKFPLFLVASLIASPAFSNEGEARTLFSTGVSAALNFKHYQIEDQIALSLPHFTANGRQSLINELVRHEIIHESVKNNGSLQTTFKPGTLESSSYKTHQGTTIYEVSSTANFNWQRCVQKTCVPVGDPKEIRVKATILATVQNNRPTLKIDSITIN